MSNVGKKRSVFECAVVGLGNIGMLYDLSHKNDYILTHTKAYNEHPRCRLICGIDRDPRKRVLFEKFAKTKAFSDIKDAGYLLGGVDIISVCVPIDNRLKVIQNIVKFKPRVIILEKPIAASVSLAKKILKLCIDSNIKICVNYFRRFENNTFDIKKVIANESLGKLLHVDIAYNRGFLNNASHYIDMLLYLIGRPGSSRIIRKNRLGNDYNIDVVLSYFSLDVHIKNIEAPIPIGEIDFWFEKGKIEYKKFGTEVLYYGLSKDKIFIGFKELSLRKRAKSNIPHVMYNVVDNVCKFLSGNENLLSNDANGLEVLGICESIIKSK